MNFIAFDNRKMTEPGKIPGRMIPSFSELLASCNIPSSQSGAYSNEIYRPSRPETVLSTPSTYSNSPPSDIYSESGAQDQPFSASSSSSPLGKRNSQLQVPWSNNEISRFDTNLEGAGKVEQPTMIKHSQSESNYKHESQRTVNNTRKSRKKLSKSISKRRTGKQIGALMEHERIIFTLSPRPATEHSPIKVVFPQNLLNKKLCLKYNTQCSQCNSKKTPEWRSGPTGSRTLCNACGLFFAKLSKKLGPEDASKYFLELKKVGNVFDRRIGSLN